MKEEIKNLRVKIDGLSQLVKQLKSPCKYVVPLSVIPDGVSAVDVIEMFKQQLPVLFVEDNPDSVHKINSNEIDKCYDSLILAKSWLGEILGKIGEETPYKNDGNRKTVDDIEPTADKAIFISDFPIAPDNWTEEGPVTASHIEKVDWLRQEIQKVQKEVHAVSDCGTPVSGLLAWNFVYQYLCEARFWLGFELKRIKESN